MVKQKQKEKMRKEVIKEKTSWLQELQMCLDLENSVEYVLGWLERTACPLPSIYPWIQEQSDVAEDDKAVVFEWPGVVCLTVWADYQLVVSKSEWPSFDNVKAAVCCVADTIQKTC